MLLVIFGAGASYDAIPVSKRQQFGKESRMPLANDLFAESPKQNSLLRDYNVVRIADVMRRRSVKNQNFDLEEELEKLQTTATSNMRLMRELFATRYYVKRLIYIYGANVDNDLHGVTNYVTLLHHLQALKRKCRISISLATFNYDMLLDNALGAVSDWKDEDRNWGNYSTGDGRDFDYYKLHGSIDWGFELSTEWKWERDPKTVIQQFNWVDVDSYEIKKYPPSMENSNVPALSLPFKGKATLTMPQFMQKRLESKLPEITSLLCVGWRGNDDHFIKLMGERAKDMTKVAVVTPNLESGELLIEKLKSVTNINSTKNLTTEFCDFVAGDELKDTLDFLTF